MNRSLRSRRRYCEVTIRPYLVKWMQAKFPVDEDTGGIILSPKYDLYHLLWHLMQKKPFRLTTPRAGQAATVHDECKLRFHLPHCHQAKGAIGKDPAFYNYISPESSAKIARHVKSLFDYEFHQWMVDNEQQPHPIQAKERLRDFIRHYQLGLDTEDCLMKNWQRYKRQIETLLCLKNRKNRKNDDI